MATVPIQTTPSVDLQVGQVPTFSATNIQPVEDTRTDDIQRFGQAKREFANILKNLQDERDDAKATEAARGYQEEADEKVSTYLSLQGGKAVATVDYDDDDTPITSYDQLIKDLDEIGNKYRDGLETGNQKTIFSDKFAGLKRISVNQASKHSITEQRKYIENETKASIERVKGIAKTTYESWNVPDGDYNTSFHAGLALIKQQAELKGQNTDPNEGLLSEQYLLEIEKFETEIIQSTIKNFTDAKDWTNLKAYMESLDPENKSPQVKEFKKSIAEKHEDYNVETTVDGALDNMGDQNSGKFLDQTAKLMSLKSNHFVDDGTGAIVQDGLHSDKTDIISKDQNENIELLQQTRDQSKFYKLDSKLTLIPEHQTTHLFAIQHLGVKKADSLYTKAKTRTLEYNKEDKKNTRIQTQEINEENKDDAKIILFNKKVIENYNELINEEVNKLYGKTKGDFVAAIANDLEIIKKGINYDGSFTDNIDFVTGLRPIEKLKQELKDTITDPKQLQYALKDLDIKYTKISNERKKIYNDSLNGAKEIAFAEEGGWKNLVANGFDIDNYTKEDQAILKKGQPEESDKDTVIDLERNPLEVKNNLENYSHKLSRSQYLKMKQYAKSLVSSDDVIAATVDSDMFDASLIRYGYTDIVNKVTDDPKAKDQYNFRFDYKQIKDEWKNRIDQVQRNTGKKLDRTEKQELLDEILADGVISKRTRTNLGFSVVDIVIPSVALEADQFKDAFVFVGSERIYVKRIPDEVREYFIAGYEAAGIPYTEQMIADEYVLHGKSKSKKDLLKFKEENNL